MDYEKEKKSLIQEATDRVREELLEVFRGPKFMPRIAVLAEREACDPFCLLLRLTLNIALWLSPEEGLRRLLRGNQKLKDPGSWRDGYGSLNPVIELFLKEQTLSGGELLDRFLSDRLEAENSLDLGQAVMTGQAFPERRPVI